MKRAYLFLSFTILSCASSTSIIGIATNEKYGAVVRSEQDIYTIQGLQKWDSTFLNKKIKLKGQFSLKKGEDKVHIKNLGTFQAQIYPKYYSVSKASWRLLPQK